LKNEGLSVSNFINSTKLNINIPRKLILINKEKLYSTGDESAWK